MATTMILKEATRMKIAGSNALSASKESGYIHTIGTWAGLIAEGIVGTGDAYQTGAVKGGGLSDGVGDGIGDMVLHGVYAMILASGVTPTAGLDLYADEAANRVDDTTANPLMGWVWPQDDGSLSRAPTSDDPAWMQQTQLAGGEVIVHVRIAGFPKTGLA